VSIRTFEPGRDEPAWLALNRRAFAHHPEQGQWDAIDLADREAEAWFDPAGFFLAERDGQLVGFHWTKVHPADPASGEGVPSEGASAEGVPSEGVPSEGLTAIRGPGPPGHAGPHARPGDDRAAVGPLGEVYVVGVDPAAAGAGLGKALTLAGLHHLRGQGLRTVMLYVDDDNPVALRLYTSLGFDRHSRDVGYVREIRDSSASTDPDS
jgi:mycothiol synthase